MKAVIDFFKQYFSMQTGWVILITLISTVIFSMTVDLKPSVDNDFFFSSNDPAFQADNKISELFLRNDSQIIITAIGDIESEDYFQKISSFSELIISFDDVADVMSISHKCNGIEAARKSKLWTRLLISDDEQSTNIIVLLKNTNTQEIVPKLEHLIHAMQDENFQLEISGFPYIVALISRFLTRDLIVFTTLAFIIFGLILFAIFHSFRILLGTLITCFCAAMFTLFGASLFGIKMGLLTANIITIVFVLTLSHLIFLTFNWKSLQEEKHSSEETVTQAVKITLHASFWSMTTTLLGFLSLLLVAAKPLRELGMTGSIGTLMAMACAYLLYPPFLKLIDLSDKKPFRNLEKLYYYMTHFINRHKKTIMAIIFAMLIMTLPMIWMLNTDPSLLSYFKKDSQIAKGLEYIDRNGGSSPLLIVLKSKDDQTLNTSGAYTKLWNLQNNIEQHRSVGSVISLPVLMSEAKNPLTFFMSWEWLLSIMEKPEFGEIAKSFVSEDRRFGLFLLRMKETDRSTPRLEIIQELKEIVRAHKFDPHLIGGVYVLQGHLSKLVTSSLINGIFRLIFIFAFIGFFISRSKRIAGALTISIAMIPAIMLGMISLLKIPLDVIAAPAANVAIGIGIDAMIHMMFAFKRMDGSMKSTFDKWTQVRSKLWQPVITSMVIVCTGFGIFFFSTFPPTQRFGGNIVFGSLVATMIALFIFPMLTDMDLEKIPSTLKEFFQELSAHKKNLKSANSTREWWAKWKEKPFKKS